MLTQAQRTHFDLFGFVVLRALLDRSEVETLVAEVDTSLRSAFAGAYASNTRHEVVLDDDVAAEGNFLPLMADSSPFSQSLVVDNPHVSGVAGLSAVQRHKGAR